MLNIPLDSLWKNPYIVGVTEVYRGCCKSPWPAFIFRRFYAKAESFPVEAGDLVSREVFPCDLHIESGWSSCGFDVFIFEPVCEGMGGQVERSGEAGDQSSRDYSGRLTKEAGVKILGAVGF